MNNALTAEIIAIGSELLTPEKIDTNSLWLTERLDEIGISVKLKTIVGDDEARLEETIRDALKRSDIVITTGGLGPTEDDLTRQVSARAVGRELQFHPELKAQLEARFKAWGRSMPAINERQAYVIADADVLPNPNGSAVGMFVDLDGRSLVVLPGPPREMQPMFLDHVKGRLFDKAGRSTVRRRVLRVIGMGESAVDEAIAPIYRSVKGLETSILFNKSEVEIHLSARSESAADADAALLPVVNAINEKLGIAVFTDTNEQIEEVVQKLMLEKGETLAVAESCTGGLIASRLTEIAGSSGYFLEGAVTYANAAKVARLGVSQDTLDRYGAVSSAVAEEMAAGIKRTAGSDHGISVTGIAGPGGGTDDKPVGTVFIGYADPNGSVRSLKLLLPGDRFLVRWRTSSAALDVLRRQLLGGRRAS